MTLRILIISNLSKLAHVFFSGQDLSCISSNPLKPQFQIFGIWMWPLWLQRSYHFPWSVDHTICSQRPSYPSQPWICKNIAKSHAIFLNYDLFLFLPFWGIKSKGISRNLLNSCGLVEWIIMPNTSSGNYIGHN